MKFCPKCKRSVPDYATRCPFADCGADIPASAPSSSVFTGTIPPAPPIPGMSQGPAQHGPFTGTIPAAPPIPGMNSAPTSHDSTPHAGFTGKIPAAPPIPGMNVEPAPEAPAHSGGFTGKIPAAPPIPGMNVEPAPKDAEPSSDSADDLPTLPPLPPVDQALDSQKSAHSGGFTGKIPAAPPIPGMNSTSEPAPKETASSSDSGDGLPTLPPVPDASSVPTTSPLPTAKPAPAAQSVISTPPLPTAQPIPTAQPVISTPPLPAAMPRPVGKPIIATPPIPVAQPIITTPPIPVAKPIVATPPIPVAQPIIATPPLPTASSVPAAQPIIATPPLPGMSSSPKTDSYAQTVQSSVPPVSAPSSQGVSAEEPSGSDSQSAVPSTPSHPTNPYAITTPPLPQSSVPRFEKWAKPEEPATQTPKDQPEVPQKLVEPPVVGFNQSQKRVEPPVAGFNQSQKRVEPPVAGFNQSQKRVEPPVAGFNPSQKRVEPPVAGFNQSQKRVEPKVMGFNQSQKRIEPPVAGFDQSQKRIEPPVMGYNQSPKLTEPPVMGYGQPPYMQEPPVMMAPTFFGMVFMPANNYLMQNIQTFLPELQGDETQEELALREELQGLHEKARRRLKRGKRLANLSFLVFFMVLAAGLWLYNRTIWSYASVQLADSITRSQLEKERIIIAYTPYTDGKIAISYEDDIRTKTIIQNLTAGQSDEFEMYIRDPKDSDHVQVTYRDEFWLKKSRTTLANLHFHTQEGTLVSTSSRLAGTIYDAETGEPVPSARISIPGTHFHASAMHNGSFSLSGFPEGEQTFEISAPNYITYQFKSRSEKDPIRVCLSPEISDGQLRFVLSWKRTPNDLDAHLDGPLSEEMDFHVCYANRQSVSPSIVKVEAAASEGFGPETITVKKPQPGSYLFYVHDFSDQRDASTPLLAQSGARVDVYFGNQLLETIRPDVQLKGNLWNVCMVSISRDLKPTIRVLGDFESKCVPPMDLYSFRVKADRLDWIRSLGGSEESEKAVEEALDWLARHQCTKRYKKQGKEVPTYGAWGKFCIDPESKSCCCEHPENYDKENPGIRKQYCMDKSGDYTVATTGMAILAFQAGGNYSFNGHKYSTNVRHGLDWLVEMQEEDGSIVTPSKEGKEFHQWYMQEHGIATLALAEACLLARSENVLLDEKYEKALKRAVDFIIANQADDGGWGQKPDKKEESYSSISGWQILALAMAQKAGCKVPNDVVEKLYVFYRNMIPKASDESKKQVNTETTLEQSQTPYPTELVTAFGILLREFLITKPDSADERYIAQASLRLVNNAREEWKKPEEVERDPDFNTWFWASLVLHQRGGEDWREWNEIVREEVIRTQCHEFCRRGSWDAEREFFFERGISGRIYATALCALTLQVYYQYTTEADRRSTLVPQNPQ